MTGNRASTVETLATSGGRAERTLAFERGSAIGRYVVLGPIGAGSMGTVVAAFDPELDRKVAIKVLHARNGKPTTLRREAQALARLSHPNVVTVYDVGTIDEHVFIAMELVDGTTLRKWCAEPRTPVEVVQAFLAAGRGLAAAHEAGIVHRDFKPDNVLVAKDGRVRVADFGIASVVGPVSSDEAAELLRQRSGGELEGEATAPHAMIGTPAYMAPEQFSRGVVDHRADQYAFCVSLFEAIAGVRPFERDSPLARVSASPQEIRRDTPRPVPARVLEVLQRGLADAPQARFPTMDALLVRLEAAVDRRWKGWALAGVAVAIAAGSWALARWTSSDPCAGAQAQLVGTWDDAARARMKAGFAASEVAFADVAFERTSDALDAWAAGWIAGYRDACEATRVRGEQSEADLELRTACLQRARRPVAALVDVLATGEADVVERAAFAVAELPDPHACSDVARLDHGPAAPTHPDAIEIVDEVRTRLAKIAALHDAGRVAAELELARETFVLADATGYEPIVAAAHRALGVAHYASGEYEPATTELQSAFDSALAIADDELAMDAALWLVTVERQRNRAAEGRRWAAIAEAYVRRNGNDPQSEARLASDLAALDIEAGDVEAALAHADRALELRLALGPENPRVGEAWVSVAKTRRQAGRMEAAAGAATNAVRIFERALGPEHPSTLTALNNLAASRLDLGDVDGAVELMRRVLDVRTRIYAEDHPRVLDATANLGVLLLSAQRHAEARPLLERMLAAAERGPGPQSLEYARALVNLASLEMATGALERADELARRGAETLDASDASPLDRATAWNTVGTIAQQRRDWNAARTAFQRALDQLRPTFGDAHPGAIECAVALAQVEWELGDRKAALVVIERVLAVSEGADLAPSLTSAMRFAAAKMLVDSDPARARTLAQRARVELATVAPASPEALAELDAWLAAH